MRFPKPKAIVRYGIDYKISDFDEFDAPRIVALNPRLVRELAYWDGVFDAFLLRPRVPPLQSGTRKAHRFLARKHVFGNAAHLADDARHTLGFNDTPTHYDVARKARHPANLSLP